ncbi:MULTISPECIES: DMT family transporter [unclassified Streptomyces]|uniref:DMT family transporter n=1 Tax=unclassified Streptomyces TaxID=2593676 RepID=UPI003D709623
MSALALSVVLSLVSAVAYAGGAIVQEQVALSSPEGSYAPLHRPSWWAAVAMNGLGGLLHVVALAYGPLSLVQPLGALTIVFALPMAALFVGRRAGRTAWRGALMATVGLAGLLSLVGASETHSLSTAERVSVALVTGGVVVALMIAGRAAHRHPAVRSVLLATASGIAFGMASVFTKIATVDWSGAVRPADLPTLAAIGVFAVAGVLLSQASYRGAGLAAPLATLTVVNPVVAAAVGITMFGETFRYGTIGTALALSCGVVAAGGLILLTTERLARTPGGGDMVVGVGVDGTPDAAAEGAPTPVIQEAGLAAREELVLEEALVPDRVLVPDQRLVPDGVVVPDERLVPDGVLVAGGEPVPEAELLGTVPVQSAAVPYAGRAAPAWLPSPLGGPVGAPVPPYGSGTDGRAVLPAPVLDRHRTRVKS